MSMFEKWCDCFDPKKEELWSLKKSEEHNAELLMSKDVPNGDPFGRAPLYHIWHNDEHVFCNANAIYAYNKWAEITGKNS